jgi:transposase
MPTRVPSRERVLALVQTGHTYEQAARALGVEPGLAYLLATGVAADGSDSLSPEDRERPGLLASSQALANPPLRHTERKPETVAWVKARAARDERPPS